MGIKKFLAVFLTGLFIFISAFAEVPKAQGSNVYTQGVYNISQFEDSTATGMLITPNTRVSLAILDHEGDIKFFKEFDTVNEVINLGTIKKGNTVAIVGNGQIAIVTTPSR